MLNGKNIIENTHIIAKNDEFYIPLDRLCNSIDMTFEYIPYKNEVTINARNKSIRMFLDKDIILVNEINRKAEKRPLIDKETVYIPICYVMELLGYNVERNSNFKLTISSGELLTKKKTVDGENIYYTNYKYDEIGNVIEEISDNGNFSTYEYNERGKRVKKIYNKGKTQTEFKYNKNGTYAEIYEKQSDGDYRIVRYNDNGNMIYAKERFNGKNDFAEITIDDNGKIISSEGSPKTSYEYNEFTQVKQKIFEDGNREIEIYDNNGEFLMRCHPDALKSVIYNEEEKAIEITTDSTKGKWIYNERGFLIEETFVVNTEVDELNYEIRSLYSYDEYGNLIVLEDGITGKEMIRNKYDEYGNLIERKEHNKLVKRYTYDKNNRLIKEERYNSSGEIEYTEEYYYE